MARELVWRPQLSVGHDELDRQHQRLFELADSLDRDLDREAVMTLVMALFDHVRLHFCLEEQVMAAAGHPGLAEHRELHSQLRESLGALDPADFDRPDGVEAFRRLVTEWATDHIATRDREYARFLAGEG